MKQTLDIDRFALCHSSVSLRTILLPNCKFLYCNYNQHIGNVSYITNLRLCRVAVVVVVMALVLGLGPLLSCGHGGCGGGGSGRGRHMVVVVGRWAMVTDCCAGGRHGRSIRLCMYYSWDCVSKVQVLVSVLTQQKISQRIHTACCRVMLVYKGGHVLCSFVRACGCRCG